MPLNFSDPKIVLTGFKPFARYPINSSWEATKCVARVKNNIVIKEISVDHLSAHDEICVLLSQNKCDILLLTGLADYDVVKLEKRAKKTDALKKMDGPEVLNGFWPWKENATALRSKSIPVEISNNAGNYVCESTYWSALNFRRIYGYPKYLTFLHVPVISNVWNVERIAGAMIVSLDSAQCSLIT